jgi:hypothetical protein
MDGSRCGQEEICFRQHDGLFLPEVAKRPLRLLPRIRAELE